MASSTEPTQIPPRCRSRLQLAWIGAAVVLLAIALHWTGDSGGGGLWNFVDDALPAFALAGAWMLMAFGIGWPLQRLVAPNSMSPLALQLGLGIVTSLALISLLGSVGAFGFGFGGRIIAIGILVTGAAVGAIQFGRSLVIGFDPDAHPAKSFRNGVGGARLGLLLAMPALVALAIAATSSPGWLWATEFGGYDALSYHLQMPREWMAIGRIVPLEHCVYSAMPNAMEAAFLHLMVVRGDALSTGIACQYLHAAFAVATALICGSAATAWADRMSLDPRVATLAATATAGLVLATPWTIVVGSLAYSEMAVTVAFATGLLILGDRSIDSYRAAGSAGLCAAVACAAKLSAVGMVAIPLALVALMVLPRSRWPVGAAIGVAIASATLAPWLIRNWIETGSATFPFLPELFGPGWWSAEQLDVWSTAHHGGGLGATASIWSKWLAFGFGAAPAPGEPWRTQWAVLPWLGILGFAALVLQRRPRAIALAIATVAIPVAFWIVATHTQSRFLVPTIVPLSLAAGLGIAALIARLGTAPAASRCAFAIVGIIGIMACWPLLLLHGERNRAPAAAIGAVDGFTGDAFVHEWAEARRTAAARRSFLDTTSPAFWINHALDGNASVLLVGYSKPWYIGHGDAASFDWSTVWDRGPLSHAIAGALDAPHAWRESLRTEGFTHVVIDLAMLDRWRRSGWLDPLLSASAINAFIGDRERIIAATAEGILLVDLRDPN